MRETRAHPSTAGGGCPAAWGDCKRTPESRGVDSFRSIGDACFWDAVKLQLALGLSRCRLVAVADLAAAPRQPDQIFREQQRLWLALPTLKVPQDPEERENVCKSVLWLLGSPVS